MAEAGGVGDVKNGSAFCAGLLEGRWWWWGTQSSILGGKGTKLSCYVQQADKSTRPLTSFEKLLLTTEGWSQQYIKYFSKTLQHPLITIKHADKQDGSV